MSSPDEGFEKKEHLLKTKDFRKVYKEGRLAKEGGLFLYALRNDLGLGRIGFSIGSRNIKRAVRRNRIRRLLREIYRRNKKYIDNGLDIIVVVKRDMVKTITYDSLKTRFLKLAKEAGRKAS